MNTNTLINAHLKHMNTHIRTYTHTRTHAYTHTHTHAHAHAHARAVTKKSHYYTLVSLSGDEEFSVLHGDVRPSVHGGAFTAQLCHHTGLL